jgi:hypothetical protein
MILGRLDHKFVTYKGCAFIDTNLYCNRYKKDRGAKALEDIDVGLGATTSPYWGYGDYLLSVV